MSQRYVIAIWAKDIVDRIAQELHRHQYYDLSPEDIISDVFTLYARPEEYNREIKARLKPTRAIQLTRQLLESYTRQSGYDLYHCEDLVWSQDKSFFYIYPMKGLIPYQDRTLT